MNTKEAVAKRIIDLCNQKNIAINALANSSGVSPSTVYSITAEADSFSMKDVSIMSKESGVEFAKVSVDGKTYIIRGDKSGTVIPNSLLSKIKSGSGRLEFHSHPHNDDCIPSQSDMNLMKTLRKSTGQRVSTIVTPNGRTSTFDENGVISTGTVSNTIDESHRQALLKLFGGK